MAASPPEKKAGSAAPDVPARNFEELFTRALDGVVILDDEGRYVDANPAACVMNGVSREHLLGMRIGAGSGSLGSDDQVRSMWRGFMQRGEMSGELRLRRPDGTVRDIEFSATASFVPHRHLAILRDVTDRKWYERRIAAQHAVTRILAEAESLDAAAPRIIDAVCTCLEWSVGGLWIADPHAGVMRCVHISRGAGAAAVEFETLSRLLTFAPGMGLPGRVWQSGSPAWIADVTRDPNFPRSAAAEREGLHAAFAFPIALGSEVMGVLEFFAHEVRQPDADMLEMLAVVSSQTGQFVERKRAEASLRDADRRKDEFLAMLAHELRNPLAPIRNAVEIVSMLGQGQPELCRASQIVVRQVEHMTRLIDDLLDVSRITRGTINLKLDPVVLGSVVLRAVETSTPMIRAREHQLEVVVPDLPLMVRADSARLEQAIANLLNNAAKYTEPRGRIHLAVETEGDRACIRVRDSGVGIAPEMQASIFELFMQVDRSLERTQGGLGIGLTLVKTLVELHGGTVHARSEGVGRGSEFVVWLPLDPS